MAKVIFDSSTQGTPTSFTRGGLYQCNHNKTKVAFYIDYVQNGSTSVDINFLAGFAPTSFYEVSTVNLNATKKQRVVIDASNSNSCEVKFNGSPNANDSLKIYISEI